MAARDSHHSSPILSSAILASKPFCQSMEKNSYANPQQSPTRGLAHSQSSPGGYPNVESPPPADTMYPWNWGDMAQTVQLSPSPDGNRRGRPRADIISALIIEGATSPSAIKCKICNRVFPREKSLSAHLRTHTGERPYTCDFPGCGRGFCQSGHLRTHFRLHTKERPFACTVTGCQSRFAHANRHCSEHPFQRLQRVDDNGLQPSSKAGQVDEAIAQWIEKYHREKEGRSPGKVRDRKLKRELDRQAEIDEIENKKLKPSPLPSKLVSSECSDEPDEMMGALALIQLANFRS